MRGHNLALDGLDKLRMMTEQRGPQSSSEQVLHFTPPLWSSHGNVISHEEVSNQIEGRERDGGPVEKGEEQGCEGN